MQDNLGRKISKVERQFFKANALSFVTDRRKSAMHQTMMADLGMLKGVKYSEIDEDWARIFKQYGITEQDWNVMRNAVENIDGIDYMAPELVEDIAIQRKFVGALVDRSEHGVLEPGLREQRILRAGTQAGTPSGAIIQLAMQFKMFPTTIITKVWGREVYGRGKADLLGLAQLMITSTIMGYMTMAARDALKNKTPKDPTKIETVYAAIMQGGAMGIAADILLQDGTGFGKSFAGLLGGPTISRADDIFKLYSAAARGEFSEAQAFRAGLSYIPGQNLFYVRPILDQALLLQMQEMMSPGYLNRVESNMYNVYGQEFINK